MGKVERMDAELRGPFQEELPQIRGRLDDFIEAELQVASEFECSIPQPESDPVVGLGNWLHTWKPVRWTNVDLVSFDANSESACELQRQERTTTKAPISSEDWSCQSHGGIQFQLSRCHGPTRLAVCTITKFFGRFYQ